MAVDSFVPGHKWVPRRQNGVEKWTKRGVNDRQKGGMWPPQVEGNFNSHQFLRCWCLFRWTDDCWNIPPEFCASSKAKMRSQKLAQLTHQPLSARAGRCTPFLSFSGWVYPFLFRDQGEVMNGLRTFRKSHELYIVPVQQGSRFRTSYVHVDGKRK